MASFSVLPLSLQSLTTKAILQPAKPAAMWMVPHAETCPPLPTQFFLLAQKLSSKQSYNIKQKSDNIKLHHHWVKEG